MKRQLDADEDEEWQCIVCLNTTDPDSAAAKEVLTLSCGHRMHLSCWLPCVLPVMGEDSAQARFIEDRSGRKCGLCRSELSSESQSALKDRRTLLREARAKVRIRHDPAMQRVRDLLRSRPSGAALGGHAIFDGMPDDDELSLPPEREPMPLDHGDLLTALSHPVGVSSSGVYELARMLRAELQQSGLSPSGELETLAHRLIEAGQATRGFFQKLLQKGLLTHAQPLRREIEKHLEMLEKAPKETAFPGPAPPPAAPPPGAPRGPVFSAGDVLLAIQPPGVPAAPSPAAPPPAAPPPAVPSPGVRPVDVATLRSMGFENEERNRAALQAANGNVEAALAILLAM